jgi:hypothetical protein
VVSAQAELIARVSAESARRWAAAMAGHRERRAMLWRLLRLSATPYFVLGTGRGESLRFRVATPWDWTRRWTMTEFEVAPQPGGQPRVGWSALVVDREAGGESEVAGHVEVRRSHGRFVGHPEAKVYLDTPHRLVPGYVALR